MGYIIFSKQGTVHAIMSYVTAYSISFCLVSYFLKELSFFYFKMPLDVIRNELSNSILSLQPEPEIPPELPPPRPHVRCC